MEILINAAPGGRFTGNRSCGMSSCTEVVGNATQWQMVTSLTKSRLGGIGVGGLLEGEPRGSPRAWKTYQSWIESGAMKSAAKANPQVKGSPRSYVIEWQIDFSLLQITAGQVLCALPSALRTPQHPHASAPHHCVKGGELAAV
jgi:hypothetical protein